MADSFNCQMGFPRVSIHRLKKMPHIMPHIKLHRTACRFNFTGKFLSVYRKYLRFTALDKCLGKFCKRSMQRGDQRIMKIIGCRVASCRRLKRFFEQKLIFFP